MVRVLVTQLTKMATGLLELFQYTLAVTFMKTYAAVTSMFKVHTTVLSTSLRGTFFAWHFILNVNIDFGLTISYQELFLFSVSLLRYQKLIEKLILWI